jgi:uncharacterized protein
VPFRLRAHHGRFGDLFAAQGDQVVAAARLLAELAGEPDDRMELANRLSEVDAAAEETVHAVLRTLTTAFVTPFDRVDVYRLAWGLRLCVARLHAAGAELRLLAMARPHAGVAEVAKYLGRAAEVTQSLLPQVGRSPLAAEVWVELSRVVRQAEEARRDALVDVVMRGDPSRVLGHVLVAASLGEAIRVFEDLAGTVQAVLVREG